MVSVLSELYQLSELQNNNQDCVNGLFLSTRYNHIIGLKRIDNNIFFSASIAFTLLRCMEFFSDQEKEVASSIVERIVKNYDEYKNNERLSYNFWKKEDKGWFPEGKILKHFKHFALPDDVDTTALILLTNSSETVDVEMFHQILRKHANGCRKYVHTGVRQFKHLATYSTWFGVDMPIETDVCVLSNLMYLIFSFKITLNYHDKAVIEIINQVIYQRLYFSKPFQIAPEYPKTATILFHICRLIGRFPDIVKNDAKESLIIDLHEYHRKSRGIDRFLSEMCLLYLNQPIKHILNHLPETNDNWDWWFTAGFLSGYGNVMLRKIAPNSLFHYRFYCHAFYNALFVEYKVLAGKQMS